MGLVGPIASGKGTTAEYVQKKYGASTHRFSTMLRDMLTRLYLPESRDALIDVSVFLRERFGEDVLAKVITRDIEQDPHPLIVVDGVRRPTDIQYLTLLPGFHLLHIHADARIRFGRLHARSENTDDQTKTFDDFLQDEQKPTEITIQEVARQAEFTIDNTGTKEALYHQIDLLLPQLQQY